MASARQIVPTTVSPRAAIVPAQGGAETKTVIRALAVGGFELVDAPEAPRGLGFESFSHGNLMTELDVLKAQANWARWPWSEGTSPTSESLCSLAWPTWLGSPIQALGGPHVLDDPRSAHGALASPRARPLPLLPHLHDVCPPGQLDQDNLQGELAVEIVARALRVPLEPRG